jgi:chromosome segregation ATPase
VTDRFKVAALGAAIFAVFIAGAFYIASLRADLDKARTDSLAAQQQVEKMSASLGQAEASLTGASKSQEDLKAQLAESSARLESLSADLGKQIESLKQQVAALQTEIAYRNKVSGWWRDLFDYTKPFKGPDSKAPGQ